MHRLRAIPATLEITTAGTLKWIAAFISTWWLNDVSSPMRTLIWLMAFDYATGLTAALLERKLNSRDGFKGLVRKGGTLALLMLSGYLEKLTHQNFNLETWGAVAYSVNEVVSIVENIARCGVPIPRRFVLALLALKNLRVQMATKEELRSLHDMASDTNAVVHQIEDDK